ncbi:putative F-box protein At3g23960 [Papaver somniferum]|uniref:putative F-box protein At3g23960 n=1 Tax=Papaver somniferum TaxID=3469 RepID=UPI000E6FA7EC|nr:putative F-box protein At3g23960 [Papaver somniferum]
MSDKVESSVSNDIPQDILLQIFYRLPVKSLGRFSCVSKLWCYLINNHQEQFHKFHMVESQKKPDIIFDFGNIYSYNRFYIVEKQEKGSNKNRKLFAYKDERGYLGLHQIHGYCNGLACYWNGVGLSEVSCNGELVYYFSFAVCSPSRVENLVTFSRLKIREDELIYGFRFGYDLVSNKYKVICIMRYIEYEYYIYTLCSAKPWRKISNHWPKQHPMGNCDFDSKKRVPPISCNGNIFYEPVKNEQETEKYKRRALVALDLHDEKIQIIKLPCDDEFVSNYNNGYYSPSAYKGCLCYSRIKKSLSNKLRQGCTIYTERHS